MTRITVDVNEGWLEAARVVLGTDTKVATINEALRIQALKAKAADILAALDSVNMDYTGSAGSFRYGGGRDLPARRTGPGRRGGRAGHQVRRLMAGPVYLADTSAYVVQARDPDARARFAGLLTEGRLAVCQMTALEYLNNAPDPGGTRCCGRPCTGSAGWT